MRARVLGAVAPFVCVLMLTAVPSRAEPPPVSAAAPLPVPGFLPPYEVTRIVRSAGFDPLAPPLREGATYVLRATDFRGILMRVVVDGHSGAIRAVNRIVAATDYQVEMMPPYGAPPYGPRPYGSQPYGSYWPRPYGSQPYGPPPYGAPVYRGPPVGEPYATLPPDGPTGYDGTEIVPAEPSAPPPPLPAHTATHPGLSTLPPLPRPRPASLVSRQGPDDGTSGTKSGPAPAAVAAKPDAPGAGTAKLTPPKSDDAKAGAAANIAPTAPATASKPRVAEPLND